jgi:competence protein ComFC
MAWSNAWKDWGTTLLGLVFPEMPLEGELPPVIDLPFCEVCGRPVEGQVTMAFVCADCQQQRNHFAWARAMYVFDGCVRETIHSFKYQQAFYRRKYLVKWITAAYDRHILPAGIQWDGLVPVPLYSLRQRDRGFNQAYEIARGLGKQRGIPVLNALRRTHDTGTQTRLSREERWRNLHNAFELRGKFDVQGKNLILIDDVFTTGATCEACAQALHKGGAQLIGVLTVARGS